MGQYSKVFLRAIIKGKIGLMYQIITSNLLTLNQHKNEMYSL
jgi:hypothetical protein